MEETGKSQVYLAARRAQGPRILGVFVVVWAIVAAWVVAVHGGCGSTGRMPSRCYEPGGVLRKSEAVMLSEGATYLRILLSQRHPSTLHLDNRNRDVPNTPCLCEPLEEDDSLCLAPRHKINKHAVCEVALVLPHPGNADSDVVGNLAHCPT
jgi:hypothetical protein